MSLKKLPLSIIILAHRNDQRLRNALASAQFAEQVLVVAVGNSLSLKNIATGVHFDQIQVPQPEQETIDFALIRNQSLDHATQEWIFFLDSDEEIEAESIPAIKTLIEGNQHQAAYIRRKDVFHNYEMKWGEVGKHWLLRIGKKESIRFLRPVHEVAKFSGNVAYPDITVTHFAHTSIADFIEKITFYARLDAQHRFKHHQTFDLFELLFFPLGKFVFNYCIKLGLLDGWRGLLYAVVMSLHSFFVRVYLFELALPHRK
jgi:glycosyltransferase involved in cell wall biosynthesis